MSKFANLSGPASRRSSPAGAFCACARYHHLSWPTSGGSRPETTLTMAYGTQGTACLRVVGMPGAYATADDTLDACLALIDGDREIRAALNPYHCASPTAAITGYHLRWWDACAYGCCTSRWSSVRRSPGQTGRPMRGWSEGGKIDAIARPRRRSSLHHRAEVQRRGCLAGIVPLAPAARRWPGVDLPPTAPARSGYEAPGAIHDVIRALVRSPHKATRPSCASTPRQRAAKLCGGKVGVRGPRPPRRRRRRDVRPCPGLR